MCKVKGKAIRKVKVKQIGKKEEKVNIKQRKKESKGERGKGNRKGKEIPKQMEKERGK